MYELARLSWGVAIIVGGAWFLASAPAEATPAFARKYETSCQTCHVAYPKLTAFGEAFRRNGYRYPAGEDEGATGEPDVALGHEAYKRVFPDAVWPGKASSSPPIAATLSSSLAYVSDEGGDFAGVGGSGGLFVSGTLGSVVSGWMGLEVEADSKTARSASRRSSNVLF